MGSTGKSLTSQIDYNGTTISPFGSGYTVQINGDEVYFRTLAEAKREIDKSATYTRGGTTFQIIEKNGKPYLQMTTGRLVDSYIIRSAKNPDKAYINATGIGRIDLNSDDNIKQLLVNYNR